MKVCMILKRNFEMLKKDSRVLREATSLLEEGHHVSILLYGGNEELKSEEEFEGINVVIIPIKTIIDDSCNIFNKNFKTYVGGNFLKKIKSKIIYLLHRIKYEFVTFNYAKSMKADVYHCHDFETLTIGYKLKRQLKKYLVYDSHEIFMEQECFLNSKLKKLLYKKIEKYIMSRTDVNITINNSIAEYFKNNYSIEKPEIVMNVPNLIKIDYSKDYLRSELNIPDNKKIVLYQGGLSKDRNLDILIKATKYFDDNIVLVFMGYGAMYQEIKKVTISEEYKEKIYLKDAVSPNVLLNYTKDADLGIHPIPNTCLNNYYCTPNKIMEYLMAGVPTLATDLPELRNILIKSEVGFLIEEGTYNEIAKKVNLILSNANARKYEQIKNNCYIVSKELYNWEVQKINLQNVYKNIIKKE